jgi:hypothetical protein
VGGGFFGGVRRWRISHLLFVTHPTLAFANGSMPALCLWGFAPQRIFIHCCYILCLVTSAGLGNKPSSAHTGVRVYRILDIDFREFIFLILSEKEFEQYSECELDPYTEDARSQKGHLRQFVRLGRSCVRDFSDSFSRHFGE